MDRFPKAQNPGIALIELLAVIFILAILILLVAKSVKKATGRTLVQISPEHFRPTEVELLIGDYKKSKEKFGWEPDVRFLDLVKIIADADYSLALKEAEE